MAQREILFSVDVEADGPIPGPYSMSSLGACVFAVTTADKAGRMVVSPVDVEAHTFYAELQPISDDFVPEAAAVSGLDRDVLIAEGEDPTAAMGRFVAWVKAVSRQLDGVPVLMAWPVPYDWMWTYWYMMRFGPSSPFGFSRALDAKSYWAGKAGIRLTDVSKRDVVRALNYRGTRRHTHNALDDAQEQGELFAAMLAFQPRP